MQIIIILKRANNLLTGANPHNTDRYVLTMGNAAIHKLSIISHN